MADDSEEKPSATHNIDSAKASIFDTLNKLREWREKQLAECRKKQYLEGEKSLQLPKESQKQLEQLLGNGTVRHQNSDIEDKPKETVPEISHVSSISLPNDLDNCDTLQESSITAHLQRCFNDSTQSNTSVSGNKVQHAPEKVPVFSELRNLQFSEKKLEENDNPVVKTGVTNDNLKSKRPFLKKGSGLLRYMPASNNSAPINNYKKSPNVNKFPVKKAQLPQKTLKLKPALRKTNASSEHVKHIRFDVTDSKNEEDIKSETNNNLLLESNANRNSSGDNIYENTRAGYSIPTVCATSPGNHKSDNSNSETESLILESKEQEAFEKIEICTQNSSFNSDSSEIQRIFQGGSVKPYCASQNYSRASPQNVIPTKEVPIKPQENPSYFEGNTFNKCREEVQARKQMLQEAISDINPRIESLQKEISYDKKQTLDDSDISDRCSTPMNLENENPISECDSNIGSSVFEASPEVQTNHFIEEDNQADNISGCTYFNVDNACEKLYPVQDNVHICNEKEDGACNYLAEADENELDLNEKSRISSKLLELQKEIETYQQISAKLSLISKERDKTMRELKKEQDSFNKYKETELQKLEAHIQQQQQQMKREKETFNRYQKLRKDNPTKKERDELSALRTENEKLQEDLKRQKIKYNNDSRRWKTRLDNAEREKDNFRMENIRLEEQCQDLISALKARTKKKIKSLDDDSNPIHNNENKKSTVEKKDAESQTEGKELDFNVFEDSKQSSPKFAGDKKSKSKAHLILNSESENNNIGAIDVDVHAEDSSKNDNFNLRQNEFINRMDNNRKGSIENAAPSVNLSVISVSVESDFKEINNGNSIERIYPSGEREVIYNSGTRKVISADGKSRKFFFYNGDTKEIFSDAREIYTYVNGVIETTLTDGMKITEFPNGQIQTRHPNGQKEVIFSDGTVHNFLSDGSEEIRTPDGNLVKNCTDGTKVIELANGQREIITSSYKRREFPDGSVKIIYDSGRQETRYSNGRIKIKDKEGKILFDTKYLSSSKG